MRPTPLSYLMKEVGLKIADWSKLSDADKESLKQWANEEMDALGMI